MGRYVARKHLCQGACYVNGKSGLLCYVGSGYKIHHLSLRKPCRSLKSPHHPCRASRTASSATSFGAISMLGHAWRKGTPRCTVAGPMMILTRGVARKRERRRRCFVRSGPGTAGRHCPVVRRTARRSFGHTAYSSTHLTCRTRVCPF